MRVAVNTRLLLKDKLEGIGWFSYEILKRIVKQHPEHKFYFIFDRKYATEFIFSDNVFPIVLFPPTRLPFFITWFFQRRIPKVLKKINADVFISPDGWIPCNTEIPIMNVIHDINFVHHSEFVPKMYSRHFKKWFPCFAKKATALVTVSEYSKKDIIKVFDIDANKVSVVYNGVGSNFKPLDKETILQTRRLVTSGEPYFIFVGSIHPRKNLNNILEGFITFKKKTKSSVKFVIVGSKMFRNFQQKEQDNIKQMRDDIIFLGRQSADKLSNLLGSALALTYISLFEGFGIPILEGFQAGVPVITSNVTAMPEVANNAAILVNPLSVAEIANAMQRIWENPELRLELIIKGQKRVKEFSWEQSAQKFWHILETII